MLLHSGVDPNGATRPILYPLWDANLKVGHSVRTVEECLQAAQESFETLTSLLAARLVCGNERLLAGLNGALGSHLAGRPLTARLVAAERERRMRHPYPLMAANLKDGRGGLRTLQSFWWERRRAELTGIPAPHSEKPAEQEAHRMLLAVRNALHATAGRALDEYVPDLREAAAQWLGTDLWETSERLTRSLRTGDQLAMQRWPDLMAGGAETTRAGRLRDRLRRQAKPAIDERRPLARARAAAAGSGGARLGAADERVVVAAASHEWIDADREDLIALLEQGIRGKMAFDWLDALGWVDANLPELSHTIAAPQLAAFHEHPVDSHLWRTVDEMRLLIDGADDWYPAIAGEVGDRRLLLLAAFLHDIGKARAGDHSEVGGDIAEVLLARIGFDDLAAPVSRLVRLHLLLAATATKRDTSDRRILEAVAAECDELRLLQALYLLTVADSRATGSSMWTDWKATLLKNLYVRVAALLEPDGKGESRQGRIAAVAAIGRTTADSIAAHVAAMPPGYLSDHSDDEVAAHYELVGRLGRAPAAVDFLDAEDAAPRVVVAAADRPGLLVAIAGVLAINNLEVLDARLVTRRDGVACDTFHVRRLLAELPATSAVEIEASLQAALAGQLDVDLLVAEKTAPYRRAPGRHLVVRTPVDPTLRFTAIEVRCEDRPGVLYEIVREIHEAGLDIRMARIDTRGDEVRDLFYVLRNGAPIRDVNEVEPVISRLRRVLRDRLDIVPDGRRPSPNRHYPLL
jgi:[protein-PII] uridylyltransferase